VPKSTSESQAQIAYLLTAPEPARGTGVNLSDEDIAEIERLRVVAMATSFGTKIAIRWLCVNDSD